MASKFGSLERITGEVLKSPRYRQISPELVSRIAQAELEKGRSFKEAVKTVKNKLHQVGGAYLDERMNYSLWLDELAQAASSPDPAAFRNACRRIMSHHASTRERLPYLDRFFQESLAGMPEPHHIMDLACGLNPLSIPWMGLPADAEYLAIDIYQDLVDFLNKFFSLIGIQGEAQVRDVIEFHPIQKEDLTLLLKTIPCLEQIDKNAGRQLIDSLPTESMMVSFPSKSLGGREKGMPANYAAHFEELVAGKGWNIRQVSFPNELVFVLLKE